MSTFERTMKAWLSDIRPTNFGDLLRKVRAECRDTYGDPLERRQYLLEAFNIGGKRPTPYMLRKVWAGTRPSKPS